MADKTIKYMEARITLDHAMEEFVKAARVVGFENFSIGDSIASSAYEAGIEQLYYQNLAE